MNKIMCMMIKVECISVRDTFPKQIEVGKRYYINLFDLHSDSDGDWYAPLYGCDENGNFNPGRICKGRFNLKHFKEVVE